MNAAIITASHEFAGLSTLLSAFGGIFMVLLGVGVGIMVGGAILKRM